MTKPTEQGTNTKCQACESMNATRYHQNTSYVDEEHNWVTLCPDCRAENDEYWQNMWDDYNRGRL